jgi:hypothetical protein
MAKATKPALTVTGEADAIALRDAPSTTPSPAKAKEKKTGTKLTLHLPPELDFRLDSLARFNKMSKSGFALKLLDQGCGGYKADKNLKRVFAEISGQTGESTRESAA